MFDLFDWFGIENCKIELVENYPCCSKDELRKREGEYIRAIDCVNKRIEGRNFQQYYQEHRDFYLEKMKANYQSNKAERNEKSKVWRDNHPEQMKQYKETWKEKNREHYLQQMKDPYENNKEERSKKAKLKTTCDCGSVCRKADLNRHYKTTKHQQYLQSLE